MPFFRQAKTKKIDLQCFVIHVILLAAIEFPPVDGEFAYVMVGKCVSVCEKWRDTSTSIGPFNDARHSRPRRFVWRCGGTSETEIAVVCLNFI